MAPKRSRDAWQDEAGRWHDYPRAWAGKVYRPGEPGGEPSPEALKRAWRILIDAWASRDATPPEAPPCDLFHDTGPVATPPGPTPEPETGPESA